MNTPEEDLDTTASLESLQTKEQREVLDIVAQLRECGLESVLSLPQLVVCGEQSAGKSSVLEALTEIPFPRTDNLCTRFATEIILHRASSNSLTSKVIPDPDRPASEQESIKLFAESIVSFDELPRVMAEAMVAMGVDSPVKSDSSSRAFARDVRFWHLVSTESLDSGHSRIHHCIKLLVSVCNNLERAMRVSRMAWVAFMLSDI